MMSDAPLGVGSVHKVYLPAGTTVVPKTRSAEVVNSVAAFAAVRQTWFHGTTFPKIVLPRRNGRLYAISTLAVPIAARTVSGGDICPAAPFVASTDIHAREIPSKSRSGTRCVIVFTVVAEASIPVRCPEPSTLARSIHPGKKLLLKKTESFP